MQRETTPVIDTDAQVIAAMESQFTSDAQGYTPSEPVSPFIKDMSNILHEAPIYANQYTDSVLLDQLRRDVLRDAPELKLGAASVAETVEPVARAEKAHKSPEKVSVKTRRSLGARALDSVRGFSKKFRSGYYAGMATAVSKLPGTRSKEEFLELDAAQKAKYADKPGDGFFTRRLNNIRRNKYELYSWAPVAAMGTAAIEMYLMRTMGYVGVAEQASPVTLPVANMPYTTPLPPEVHPPVVDIPAPKPAPVDVAPAPVYKHKTPQYYPDTAPTPVKKQPVGGTDFVIPVGGATDPNGDMPAATVNPNTKMLRVNYPAEMGPFVGSTPTNVSQDIGVRNVIDLVKQHPGAKITLKGFSEGSFVTNEAARQLAEMGIHVNVVNAGDGNGAAGILQRPEVPMIQPFLTAAGINYTPPVPGSTEILSGRDAWASTANDPLGVALGKAMNIPVDHRIPGEDEIPVQTFTKDGVYYKIYDQPVDLPIGAVDTTPGGSPVPVPPPIPMPGPDLLPPPAPGPDLPPPPAPEAMKSPEPAFFGEQACVAPDGSQYFTPGDAPC